MRRVRAVALRHALEFRCSGGDCPESCCRVGWRIPVDEGHYRKLKRALGEQELARLCEPLPPERRNRASFALLVLDEHGACPQLDGRGLCRIHAHHGPGLLPDTCALYPRVPSLVGSRHELQLALSCPESARGCLLGEGAVDLVEAPPSLFPADRKEALRTLPDDSPEPYVARFDDVRGAAYELLGDRTWPVATRIAFTLALADRLAGFFHPGTTSYSDALFDQVVASLGDEATREALHRQLQAPPRPDERLLAPHFVLEMLATRLAVPAQESFLRVTRAALEGCADPAGRRRVTVAGGAAGAPLELTASPERLLAVHARRREALPEALAERAEGYFENYARAYWIREWYFHAPSLVAHAQALALRVAVLRFLLLGHPDTARAIAAAAGPEPAAAGPLLDEAMVECTWAFSRATEHQDALFESVMRTFEAAGLHGIRHGLSLLRF